MKTVYKWIEFKLQTPGQTPWKVYARNKSHDLLGYVDYYPPWKEFCFDPAEFCFDPAGEIVLSPTCLRDIASFCLEATSIKEAGK